MQVYDFCLQNELVLAVGGFDKAYGSVKLVSYDQVKSQRQERQWE